MYGRSCCVSRKTNLPMKSILLYNTFMNRGGQRRNVASGDECNYCDSGECVLPCANAYLGLKKNLCWNTEPEKVLDSIWESEVCNLDYYDSFNEIPKGEGRNLRRHLSISLVSLSEGDLKQISAKLKHLKSHDRHFDSTFIGFLMAISKSWATDVLIEKYPDAFYECFESGTKRGWEYILENEERLVESNFLWWMWDDISMDNNDNYYLKCENLDPIIERHINPSLYKNLFRLIGNEVLSEETCAEFNIPEDQKHLSEWFNPFEHFTQQPVGVFGRIPFEEVLGNYNCDYGEDEFEEFWDGACIEIIKASHRRRGRFISYE